MSPASPTRYQKARIGIKAGNFDGWQQYRPLAPKLPQEMQGMRRSSWEPLAEHPAKKSNGSESSGRMAEMSMQVGPRTAVRRLNRDSRKEISHE